MIGGMTDADLRSLLAAGDVTHVPGVHDPASAVLAVRAGNRAVYLSGAAIAATMLGRPDVAFVPATQIADRAAGLTGPLGGVPLLADATIGFDSADDAVWTALAYQRAGVGGLVLGDGEDVRPSAARIIALAEQAPSVAVIAQAAGRGLAETIERARAYAAAGADAILPAEVHAVADLDRIRHAIPGVPLVLSRSETVTGALRLTDAELAALGVRMVLHPLAAVLAALRAESLAYRAIADEGTAERVDRLPPAVLATMTEPAPAAPRPARRPAPPSAKPAADPTTPATPRASATVAAIQQEIARIDT
jgi:methylisocitrate lyase